MLFTSSDGSQTDPLIKDRKYWSQGLRDALGFHQDRGFPAQLSPLIENKPQPVPAVDFHDNITKSVADIFNKEIKIYVTPTEFFYHQVQKRSLQRQRSRSQPENTRESGFQSLT